VTSLERFQIVVGIVVSVATLAIGWKTFELNALTERNNEQLTQIKDKLSEDKFAFERLREIYDRTEKYLSSNDQGEKRGKALTVLIKSIPDPTFRQDLLSLVVTESKSVVVAAAAANVQSPIDISARAPTIDVARPGTSGFIGVPSFKLDDNGYTPTVVDSIRFRDSKGVLWEVPSGFTSDGASIPRVLWSSLGAPLTGKLRFSAVLHDYYTNERTRSAEDVNSMFLESLRSSGVEPATTKVLYEAVVAFGPRWDAKKPGP